MTPDKLLDDGADAIETYGHVKGRSGDTRQGFCYYGAVYHAYVTYLRSKRASDSVMSYSGLMIAAGGAVAAEIDRPDLIWSELPKFWNDLDATTPTEVIDTMRHAAKRLRGGA